MQTNNNLHNSIAFDIRKDDLTYNGYMALAHAICGVKDCNGNWKPVSTGKIRRIYGLLESEAESKDAIKVKEVKIDKKYLSKKKCNFKYIDIKVKDLLTGEIKEFETSYQVADFLKMTNVAIISAIHQNSIVKKRYTLECKINEQYNIGSQKMKPLKLINIYTDEEKTFNNGAEAAKYIQLSQSTVSHLAKSGNITKRGWKVEFIEE